MWCSHRVILLRHLKTSFSLLSIHAALFCLSLALSGSAHAQNTTTPELEELAAIRAAASYGVDRPQPRLAFLRRFDASLTTVSQHDSSSGWTSIFYPSVAWRPPVTSVRMSPSRPTFIWTPMRMSALRRHRSLPTVSKRASGAMPRSTLKQMLPFAPSATLASSRSAYLPVQSGMVWVLARLPTASTTGSSATLAVSRLPSG